MRLHVTILLLAVLAASAGSAAPKGAEPAGAALRFMGGDCDRLAIGGGARPCRPELVSLVYASGAVSFVFAGKDGRLLSFSGRIAGRTGEQTKLRVDQVTVVPRGGGAARAEKASGSCLLTPFAVDRSRVDCSARAGGSRFAAVFRTSDRKPRLLTLAGG